MKKLNILLLLVSGFISAQITTSSISGVVVDDANMELEGANVVAVHVPTGTTYGVVTNQDGRFNMVNMRGQRGVRGRPAGQGAWTFPGLGPRVPAPVDVRGP